jgi:hypothetical protein
MVSREDDICLEFAILTQQILSLANEGDELTEGLTDRLGLIEDYLQSLHSENLFLRKLIEVDSRATGRNFQNMLM